MTMPNLNRASNLTELVPWILDRVLDGSFVAEQDSNGELETLEISRSLSPPPPTMEEMEQRLRAMLPSGKREALFALRDSPTPENLREAMVQIFGPDHGPANASKLSGHGWDWDTIWDATVACVYDFCCCYLPSLVERGLSTERRGIGSEAGAHLESQLEEGRPGFLSQLAAMQYARELSKLYSRIVRRDESLRILSTSVEAPSVVAAYVVEASRCYVYGHFLAALVLCRSAMEAAVEDRLRTLGLTKEVSEIREDRLLSLLDLAKQRGLLDVVLWRQAGDIRKLANRALHGKPPSEEECKSAHDLTRGVLEHLYA